jgi:WD40 repeat protein/Tfp pilus assembly protein PilF
MPILCPHCQKPIEPVDSVSQAGEPRPSLEDVPEGMSEKLWRWCRHNPRAAALTFGTILILLVLLGLTANAYWHASELVRQKTDEGQLARQEAETIQQARAEESAARQAAEKRVEDTRASLRRALLRQAEALVQPPSAGQRRLALDALKQAAAIRLGPDLRQTYLRCLDLSGAGQGRSPSDPAPLSRITSFGRPVTALQFGPKDQWLACAMEGGELRMIDLQDSALVAAPLPSPGKAPAVAFSSEGDKLWSADTRLPGQVDEVWQMPSPKPTRPTADLTRIPDTLAFTSRGERFAAGSECAVDVKMLALPSGKVLWTYSERALPGVRPIFSPDGKRLAAALLTGTGPRIKVWNSLNRTLAVERFEPSVQLFFRGEQPFALVDGPAIVVRNLEDQTVSPPLRRTAFPPAGPEDQYLFSADGTVCAESANEKSFDIAIWDLMKRALRTTIKRSAKPRDLHAKALSPDGSLLAAFGGDSLFVWNAQNGKPLATLAVHPYRFAFVGNVQSPQLLLLEKNGNLLTWQPGAKTAAARGALRLTPGSSLGADAEDVLFTADGKRVLHLAPAANPATLDVYDVATGQRVAQVPVPVRSTPDGQFPGARHRIAVSSDGSKFCILSTYLSKKVWNQDTGHQVLDLGEINATNGFEFLQLGREAENALAVTSQGPKTTAKLFDLVDRSEALTVSLPEATTSAAVEDRGILVALGQKREIWVYETRSQKKIATLLGHEADVSDLVIGPDGQMLASASAGDGTARLWQPRTGELLATLYTGMKDLKRIALSPSGRWLAAGDASGRVRVWDLAEGRRQLAAAKLDWSAPAISVTAPPAAGSAAAYLDVARRHHLFQRYEQAIEAFGRSLALDGSQALAHRDRAEVYSQLNRYTEAAGDYEKAKELAPELPYSAGFLAALQNRGLVEVEAGQWVKARADFMKAVKNGAERGKSQHDIAVLRLAAGDLKGYQRVCLSLVEHLGEKEKPSVVQPVVWTCVLGPNTFGEYKRLVELAEDGVDVNPKDWIYHNTLGAALCRAGEYDAAIQRLRQSIQVGGKDGHPRDWLFLTLAYYQVGHNEEAIKWLDQAARVLRPPGGGKTREPAGGQLAANERLELLILLNEMETLVRGTKTSPKAEATRSE